MKKTTSSSAPPQTARLILEDGSVYPGRSFGYPRSAAGEVVFNTGMVGYPESLTDPSYRGEILALTYPLVGNYGAPADCAENRLSRLLESGQIQAQGLIVSDYSPQFQHWNASRSLSEWLNAEKVPALSGIDTRALTKKLREKGTMLGKIEFEGEPVDFVDPNRENLAAQVSIREPVLYGEGERKTLLIDCGCKHNIIRSLLRRNLQVLRVPWNYDFSGEEFHGLLVSNGPGDPKMCRQTIYHLRQAMAREIPIFGICLGHQLLALAAGANTYKLKYGHRSQNQPVLEAGGNRALVTSQNHGFAVENGTLPRDWQPWFVNLNDGSNEGIRHASGRFMGVQFHPEASPGPVDAGYLFDEFVKMLYL